MPLTISGFHPTHPTYVKYQHTTMKSHYIYKYCTSEISHPAPFLIFWILIPFNPQSCLWKYWVKDQISSHPIWVWKADFKTATPRFVNTWMSSSHPIWVWKADFKTATPRFVNTWMSSNLEAHVANTYLFCIHSPISKLNYKNREKKSSPHISYECITKTVCAICFLFPIYTHYGFSHTFILVNPTKKYRRFFANMKQNTTIDHFSIWQQCISSTFILHSALQHILHTHPIKTQGRLERSDLWGGVISWVKFEGWVTLSTQENQQSLKALSSPCIVSNETKYWTKNGK